MRMTDWHHEPTTAHVGGIAFHKVETPAADVIVLLDQEDDFKAKVRLAFVALFNDPGCIEAHVFLAEHAKDDEAALAHLEKAVATGRHLWFPVAAEQGDFAFWGVAATRPFMRALEALGQWHEAHGDVGAAREAYDELLDLNPVDSQGIRFRVEELKVSTTAPFSRLAS